MTRVNPDSSDPEDLPSVFARALARFEVVPDADPAPAPRWPTSRGVLEARGFPRRALDCAERATETEAIAAIREFTEPGVFVLAGEKGSGKTVAATVWALGRPTPSRMITASLFARQSRYGEDRRELMDCFRSLVLDDLGTEYADDKGAFVSDLDELINIAYSDRRRLIITTNSDSVAFTARYGDRIVDRLAEAGKWVTLETKSMRGPSK